MTLSSSLNIIAAAVCWTAIGVSSLVIAMISAVVLTDAGLRFFDGPNGGIVYEQGIETLALLDFGTLIQ